MVNLKFGRRVLGVGTLSLAEPSSANKRKGFSTLCQMISRRWPSANSPLPSCLVLLHSLALRQSFPLKHTRFFCTLVEPFIFSVLDRPSLLHAASKRLCLPSLCSTKQKRAASWLPSSVMSLPSLLCANIYDGKNCHKRGNLACAHCRLVCVSLALPTLPSVPSRFSSLPLPSLIGPTSHSSLLTPPFYSTAAKNARRNTRKTIDNGADLRFLIPIGGFLGWPKVMKSQSLLRTRCGDTSPA